MSKSWTIRMAIGPIKKRLVDNISIALKLVTDDIPSDSATCVQLVNKIETATAKLRASIDSLTDRDRQWSDMMLKLDEDGVAIEEKLYSDVPAAATGYIVVLEEGKELVNQLVSKQRQIKQVVEAAPSASSLAGNNTPSTPLPANRPTTVKLPKIDLPTFAGDPTEWPQFWTVFEATVHNASLTNVEKFSYLSQLRTPAIDTIGGLPITDNGYNIAVDVLKERFHRAPEQLVSNLYGQLKRLPSASGQVKEMRATYDSCEKIFRQLKDANEDVESNRSLVLDIWSKYPEQVLKDMKRRKAINAQSTLTQVQKALKDYINEADSLSDMQHDLEPFHHGSRKFAPKDRSSSSQSANYTSSNSSWNRSQSNHSPALAVSTGLSDDRHPKSPCYFCNGSHFNSQCDQYVTAEQRRALLTEVNRCVRCLDSTHLVGERRTRVARIRCHFCQTAGVHPSPLCPVHFANPAVGAQVRKPSQAAKHQPPIITQSPNQYQPCRKLPRHKHHVFLEWKSRPYWPQPLLLFVILRLAPNAPFALFWTTGVRRLLYWIQWLRN